jgi:hypothetical protein
MRTCEGFLCAYSITSLSSLEELSAFCVRARRQNKVWRSDTPSEVRLTITTMKSACRWCWWAPSATSSHGAR